MNYLKTFWPMIQSFLLGQARTGLAAVGGILVTDGVMTSSQTSDFIGSGLFLAALAFSAFDKFVVNAKIKTALNTAPPGMVIVPGQQGAPIVTMAPIANPT